METASKILKTSDQLKKFTVGNDHNVFLVNRGKEKFVLKQYRFRSTYSVRQEAEWIDFLSQKNNKTPKLIADKNKKLFFLWRGKPAILMEYLQGNLLLHEKITDNLLMEIGKELGKLDKTSSCFSNKKEPNRNKMVNNLLKPHPLFKHSASKKFLKSFRGLEKTAKELFSEYEKNIPLIKKLPRQLIHNDVSERNIIVLKNKISGFIDFSDHIKAPAVFNLATAAAHLCFLNNRWQKNLNLFITAYKNDSIIDYWENVKKLLPFLIQYRLFSEMATNFYLGNIVKEARDTEITNNRLWTKLFFINSIPQEYLKKIIRNCV